MVDPEVWNRQARDEPCIQAVIIARLQDARAEAAADGVIFNGDHRDPASEQVLEKRHINGLGEARVVQVNGVLTEEGDRFC